ncbi:MAG: SAM-dependent methyltransferase, partial [Pseudomonadota bacterium]
KTIRNEEGEVIGVLVADYFRRTDGEVETWTFNSASEELRTKHPPFNVPRFHRTLSDWVAMITRAGFTIEALQEPMADEATAKAVPNVADTRITPIFLHFRLRKPV